MSSINEGLAAPTTARLPVPDALEETRLVAILRHIPSASILGVTDALVAGGVRVVEVTLNSADAADSLRRLSASFRQQLLIGAGTVLDSRDAEEAVACGATFLVTPHVDPSLIATAARLRVPIVAGAMTPTEILTAWRAGATLVKLFPAGRLGADYVRDVRGPLGDIPLIATGGVTLDNAPTLVAAGAWGLAVGSALHGGLVDTVDRERSVELASAFVRVAAAARAS